MFKQIAVVLALAALAGCSAASKPCTDQLAACGQRVATCAAQAGCDVSACASLLTPKPTK